MNDANASTGPIDFSLLAIAQRLARVMDPGWCLFSEVETDEQHTSDADVEALAPCTPNSPAARRLAIAFAVAGSLGMPERTRLSLMTDWACTLFAKAATGESRCALMRAVEFARMIEGLAEPETYPGLQDVLFQMNSDEPSSDDLEGEDDTADDVVEAAVWVRHAVERYTRDSGSPQLTDPFNNWSRAADMLGSVERAGGEPAIAACFESFRKRVLAWAVTP